MVAENQAPEGWERVERHKSWSLPITPGVGCQFWDPKAQGSDQGS